MNNILIIFLPRAECYLAQKEKLQDERRSHSQGTHSNSLFWFLWHSIVQRFQATASSNGSYGLQPLEGLPKLYKLFLPVRNCPLDAELQ